MLKKEILTFLESIQSEENKKIISKLQADINQFQNDGDLLSFLVTFKTNEKRIKFNEKYITADNNSLFKIISKYEHNTDFIKIKFENINKNKKYSSFEISSLAENFNTNLGMYHVSKLPNKVVLKANVDDQDISINKYKNRWLINDKLIEYCLMNEKIENFKSRHYSHAVNKIMYESYMMDIPLEIYIFVRKNKKDSYEFSGIYSILSFNDKGNKVQLINNENISDDDISIYDARKMSEEGKIKIIGDPSIYSKLNIRARKYQGLFRKKLIQNYGAKCILCDIDFEEILIASHIKPYANCASKEESCDENNGLILCPMHDALFDNGLISFDETGKINISDKLKLKDMELYGVNEMMKISNYKDQEKYMSYHRKNVFEK